MKEFFKEVKNKMEEKILIVLQEIKKELQGIRSILEPNNINTVANNIHNILSTNFKDEAIAKDAVILRDKCLSILSTTLIEESMVPKYTDIVIDCLRVTRNINRIVKNHILDNEIGTLEKLINKLSTMIHSDLTEDEAILINNLLDSIRSMAV
jgi:hypothetical protein